MIFQIKNKKFLNFYNTILENKKINSQKKNSSFVTLILVIFKFRNPGCSAFDRSIFCIPLANFQFQNSKNF